MPAKGTRKLTDTERAQILAEKRIKTAKTVAHDHGISPSTVYSMERRSSEEVRELAKHYYREVIEQARVNVLFGLRAMESKLIDPATPLRDLTTCVKVNHDIAQAQANRPSDAPRIISDAEEALLALEFIKSRGIQLEDARDFVEQATPNHLSDNARRRLLSLLTPNT